MKNGTKVFGIGLSRTGTVSLTKALIQLGINAKHYPRDATTQDELKRGKYALSILEEADALLDIPVAPYYAQFDEVYPDAKFILTTRPTDAWLASVENHYRMYVENMRDAFDDYVMACVYGTLHFTPDRFTYVKELHERNVRDHFSERPDKLLEFDVFRGDSWPELCHFLDRPIPDVEYPHRNEALTEPAKRRPRSWIRDLLRATRRR